MTFIKDIARTIVFFGLVFWVLWFVFYELSVSYPFFIGLPLYLGLFLFVYDPKRFPWLLKVAKSADQTFGVVYYPFLNWLLDPKTHVFGHEDEWVSSVIGKQIRDGDTRKHWHYIEVVLRHTLERNKRAHCINSIEDDEGTTK